jgi:hypothetical protein
MIDGDKALPRYLYFRHGYVSEPILMDEQLNDLMYDQLNWLDMEMF